MSLGSFDRKFLWWWEAPDIAAIEHDNGAWIEVNFSADDTATRMATALGYDDAHRARDVGFYVSGEGEYHRLTGYGRAATLFATVAEIIQRYLRRAEPPLLAFMAVSPRHANVYEALIRRVTVPLYRAYSDADEDYVILREPHAPPPAAWPLYPVL